MSLPWENGIFSEQMCNHKKTYHEKQKCTCITSSWASCSVLCVVSVPPWRLGESDQNEDVNRTMNDLFEMVQ